MGLANNTLTPMLIQDARQAAHTASENQRACEDRIRKASKELAVAEQKYREALSKHILKLKADGMAITMCGEVARGEKAIAKLRFDRDVAAGIFEAAKQEAFRRGADRRDTDTLLNWSMKREMATDTPPASWFEEHGVNPKTGEVVR